jgi:hypothetical protein
VTPQMLARLQEDITAVCPNHGVSVAEDGPPIVGRIDYAESATQAQRDAADAVMAGFDQSPEAQAAWETQEIQDKAIEDNVSKSPEGQLRRAMDREMFDYFHKCVREHNNLCNKLGETNMLVAEQSWQQVYDAAKARVDAGGA